MIHIKNLTFRYPNALEPALRNINFNVSPGEFVGIIGPAGAGKSTLTLCLSGVIPHFQPGNFYGTVRIDGRDTIENGCAPLASTIGSVFQDPEAQIVSPIVEDEIAFGLENLNIPRGEMGQRITESLELTGISHLRPASTSRLSGGQKQRVAVAAALALRPKILVLDEPRSELDPQGSLDIFNTLRRLNAGYGITVVVVEQKISLLSQYCSKLAVMNKGSIILEGSTREILSCQDVLQDLGVNGSPIAYLTYLLKNNSLYQGNFPVNPEEAYLILQKILSKKKTPVSVFKPKGRCSGD